MAARDPAREGSAHSAASSSGTEVAPRCEARLPPPERRPHHVSSAPPAPYVGCSAYTWRRHAHASAGGRQPSHGAAAAPTVAGNPAAQPQPRRQQQHTSPPAVNPPAAPAPNNRRRAASQSVQSPLAPEQAQPGRSARRRLDFSDHVIGPLDAAETLLRNPPPTGTALEAYDKWCHDVARFIAAGPAPSGDSQVVGEPKAPQPQATLHSCAPLPGAQEQPLQGVQPQPRDLCDVLNSNRAAEDARLVIERSREHRRQELYDIQPLQPGAQALGVGRQLPPWGVNLVPGVQALGAGVHNPGYEPNPWVGAQAPGAGVLAYHGALEHPFGVQASGVDAQAFYGVPNP